MSRLRIAPIVEGHGEVQCIRTLLERIWHELVGGEYVDVVRPIRQPRNRLVQKEQELCRTIELAASKLADPMLSPERHLILVLLDADEDPPCRLGPEMLESARKCRGDQDIACVLTNKEYETWFVAAAESLRDELDLPDDEPLPTDPEADRLGKKWIQDRRFRGSKYSETVEQPKFTAMMDLAECRRNSPSFDKPCRELEDRFDRPSNDVT